MRLGLSLGFMKAIEDPTPLVQEAETLGYHSVWVAEAWGSDAVSTLGWIAARTKRIGIGSAILQMPARTPAMTAMTAATLDGLSEGRFLLGLGVSGPQVIEGWHGVPYDKPLQRTREYVEIVRAILRRDGPLEHRGAHYQIPLQGGTGLGKPLKLMVRPRRSDIPIYLAAIGPRNTALAAEIADGWLPIFYSPFHREVFEEHLKAGLAGRTDAAKDRFDIAPTVGVSLGDDLDRCWESQKPNLALYIGGMGARGKNFYFDLACRYGYAREARMIQELFLGGKKAEATAAVPNELVDEVCLCGPPPRVAERLAAWREAGVGTLLCAIKDRATLRAIADIALDP
jgi:F420-dependent oxidoreductase-like protein